MSEEVENCKSCFEGFNNKERIPKVTYYFKNSFENEFWGAPPYQFCIIDLVGVTLGSLSYLSRSARPRNCFLLNL